MCQLVNLGEMMKQFAEEIKRLLVAMVQLMKAAMEKFSKDFPALMGNIGGAVNTVKADIQNNLDVAKEKVEARIDDLKDQMKDKLQFWK
jgi:gas vesicle protein